jgi:hypothetical protein
MPAINSRIYKCLDELIPDLPHVKLGQSFFATPRIKDDMAFFCSITKNDSEIIELELAHDQVVNGEARPARWMSLTLNTDTKTAELLDLHEDGFIYSQKNINSSRKTSINIFVVNWLNIILHIQSSFQPCFTAGSQLTITA